MISPLSIQLLSGCCGKTSVGFLRFSHIHEYAVNPIESHPTLSFRLLYTCLVFMFCSMCACIFVDCFYIRSILLMVLSCHFKKENQQKRHLKKYETCASYSLDQHSVCLHVLVLHTFTRNTNTYATKQNRLVLCSEETCGVRTINLNGDNEKRALSFSLSLSWNVLNFSQATLPVPLCCTVDTTNACKATQTLALNLD